MPAALRRESGWASWVSRRSIRYSASPVSSRNRILPSKGGNQGVPARAASTERLPPTRTPVAGPDRENAPALLHCEIERGHVGIAKGRRGAVEGELAEAALAHLLPAIAR